MNKENQNAEEKNDRNHWQMLIVSLKDILIVFAVLAAIKGCSCAIRKSVGKVPTPRIIASQSDDPRSPKPKFSAGRMDSRIQ